MKSFAIPEMKFSSGIFSLTPALSRWEREKLFPRSEKMPRWIREGSARISGECESLFPLPAGEGQGEGEHRQTIFIA
jgi:hypothetical protein